MPRTFHDRELTLLSAFHQINSMPRTFHNREFMVFLVLQKKTMLCVFQERVHGSFNVSPEKSSVEFHDREFTVFFVSHVKRITPIRFHEITTLYTLVTVDEGTTYKN